MEKLKSYISTHLPIIEETINNLLKDIDPYVKDIVKHIIDSGGKRLRPLLCLLTAGMFGYRRKDVYPLACVLEFIHSATLLHDDIIDHAPLRRGNKTAHMIFGITKTILAGDALLALSNQIVTKYNNIGLMSCLSEAIYRTASGEILELAQMEKTWITEEEYLNIISGKTAYLIQFSCESGAILAGANDDELSIVRTFGLNLGIAFQLVDDVLDYSLNQEKLGKPVGGDLKEGKITLPLIFYLDSIDNSTRYELLRRIKNSELSEDEINEILHDINKKGILKQALKSSDSFLQKAKDALLFFPNSVEKEILSEVVDFVKNREY